MPHLTHNRFSVHRFSVSRLVAASLCLLAVSFALAGCGYVVGPAHDPAITSIEIPTFENDTYRRGLEQMLTEAVHREVAKRTTMRIVRGPGAQTKLTGRIVDAQKSVLGETMFDDPRELQLSLIVEVRWEDTRTGRVIEDGIPIDADSVDLFSQSDFAPEVGQSMATATNDVVTRTARRIVDLMELSW
ncbi:MAG: LPS assembly lipoprotein LptE [Planctomycetota bacterium]|nr:LPS assembly lipoprotein LptE [Planctomycetota bacterium]MDA1250893.1 LPS assembly lipoprotein LptE [Planctomycetota bacterium]